VQHMRRASHRPRKRFLDCARNDGETWVFSIQRLPGTHAGSSRSVPQRPRLTVHAEAPACVIRLHLMHGRGTIEKAATTSNTSLPGQANTTSIIQKEWIRREKGGANGLRGTFAPLEWGWKTTCGRRVVGVGVGTAFQLARHLTSDHDRAPHTIKGRGAQDHTGQGSRVRQRADPPKTVCAGPSGLCPY